MQDLLGAGFYHVLLGVMIAAILEAWVGWLAGFCKNREEGTALSNTYRP